MDEDYLSAYTAYEGIVGTMTDDGKQHIVLHQPDMYIKLLLETQKLQKEIDRLRPFEWKWQMEMKQNLNFISKLQWCKDELDKAGIKPPFRLDGSDR